MSLIEIIKIIETSAILSSFLSGILLLCIGSILLPRYLHFLKRPKIVEFFDKNSGDKNIVCTKKNPKEYTFSFEPILRNKGGEALMSGVFWNMSFPSFVKVSVNSLGRNTVPGYEELEDGTHTFFGKIDQPVFENVTIRLQYIFDCTLSAEDVDGKYQSFPLVVWFSTEYGDYPKGLKRLNNFGSMDWRTMDKINIILK